MDTSQQNTVTANSQKSFFL